MPRKILRLGLDAFHGATEEQRDALWFTFDNLWKT